MNHYCVNQQKDDSHVKDDSTNAIPSINSSFTTRDVAKEVVIQSTHTERGDGADTLCNFNVHGVDSSNSVPVVTFAERVRDIIPRAEAPPLHAYVFDFFGKKIDRSSLLSLFSVSFFHQPLFSTSLNVLKRMSN